MMPMHGLRAAYHFSASDMIEASITTGSVVVIQEKYEKNLYELRYKRFLLNSLYIAAGLGIESWAFRDRVLRSYGIIVDPDYTTVRGTSQNYGGSVHIGNQWQFDGGFSFGFDWFGWFWPLTSSFTVEENSDVNPYTFESTSNSFRSAVTGDSPHVLRTYLGWTW
jgi:hypothetical protein